VVPEELELAENSEDGWCYQECWTQWTCWAFGWQFCSGRGWQMDELMICFGPWRWEFVR
jgi:hypothetical protein